MLVVLYMRTPSRQGGLVRVDKDEDTSSELEFYNLKGLIH
jgi:hypothetical protein